MVIVKEKLQLSGIIPKFASGICQNDEHISHVKCKQGECRLNLTSVAPCSCRNKHLTFTSYNTCTNPLETFAAVPTNSRFFFPLTNDTCTSSSTVLYKTSHTAWFEVLTRSQPYAEILVLVTR